MKHNYECVSCHKIEVGSVYHTEGFEWISTPSGWLTTETSFIGRGYETAVVCSLKCAKAFEKTSR